MKNGSVRRSLVLISLVLVVVSVVVIGGISIIGFRSMSDLANSEYESATMNGYDNEIKAEVQSVLTILQGEYEKTITGELSEDEAKYEAAEIVRSMRYGDDSSGYFWIDDTDYILVMHPILPEQEGNNRYELEDQNGIMMIKIIYTTCKSAEQ